MASQDIAPCCLCVVCRLADAGWQDPSSWGHLTLVCAALYRPVHCTALYCIVMLHAIHCTVLTVPVHCETLLSGPGTVTVLSFFWQCLLLLLMLFVMLLLLLLLILLVVILQKKQSITLQSIYEAVHWACTVRQITGCEFWEFGIDFKIFQLQMLRTGWKLVENFRGIKRSRSQIRSY